MFGHPALRRLLVLKFKGALRAQFRKLRRPLNVVYWLAGMGVFLFWYSFVFLAGLRQRDAAQGEFDLFTGHGAVDMRLVATQSMMLLLTGMTVLSAFSHRGLYLPKEEIELAFAAPVKRSDLVRYRLLVNMLRSVLVGSVFGMLSAMRMPLAVAAFFGTMLSMCTLTVAGQAAAILLGGAENRLAKIAQKLPLKLVVVLLTIVLITAVSSMVVHDESFMSEFVGDLPATGAPLERLAGHPWVHAVLLPFTPWARMITAPTMSTFLPWFAACIVLWFAAFELTARIPVDYRELSLATSADVAKRLNRVRRGWVGASSTSVDKQSLSWRVPWLFGRGPFGAVAWLKLGQIVRKARGTLITSTLIIVVVSVLFTVSFRETTFENALGAAALLSAVGTLYLCMGLRFDFRADLELMSLVKTWPLAPWRIFLATILPEVALVSGLLWAAVLVRGLIKDALVPEIACILLLQPLITFTWVAVDNTVFLFSPLRYSPGQESALQHMGRSVYLVMLRTMVFGVVILIAAVPVAAFSWFALNQLDWGVRGVVWIAGLISAIVLFTADIGLVMAGGWMLRRFDVARDRGV